MRYAFLALFAVTAATGHAQELEWHFDAVKTGNEIVVASRSGGPTFDTPTAVATGSTVNLVIHCSGGLNCHDVVATRALGPARTSLVAVSRDSATVHYTIRADELVTAEPPVTLDLSSRILFSVDDSVAAFVLPLYRGAVAADPTSIADLLGVTCAREISVTYDQRSNLAQFVVTPLGNVLARPNHPIDEDDQVLVYVVAPADIVPTLSVKRKSAFRTVGSMNLLGEGDLKPLREGIENQGSGGSECAVLPVALSDFSPGRGEVEISKLTDKGTSVVGSFDFGVNHLYTGAFSFGPVFSWVEDFKFRLLPNPDTSVVALDSIIAVSEERSPRLHYVIAYTPFVWGKLDIEKGGRPWYQNVNPVLAITLEDILDNAFVGLSAHLFGASLHAMVGYHIRQHDVLDPAAGYRERSPFDGSTTDIPTLNEWDAEPFMGATVDLRAAVKLFGAVLGAVGS